MRLRKVNLYLAASIVFTLIITGCASFTTASTSNQNQVYAAGQSLAILGNLVTAYDGLPACASGGPTLCSTTVMKQNLAKAMIPAINAYMAAQSAVQAGQAPDMVTLNAALTSLQSLTNALPKQ